MDQKPCADNGNSLNAHEPGSCSRVSKIQTTSPRSRGEVVQQPAQCPQIRQHEPKTNNDAKQHSEAAGSLLQLPADWGGSGSTSWKQRTLTQGLLKKWNTPLLWQSSCPWFYLYSLWVIKIAWLIHWIFLCKSEFSVMQTAHTLGQFKQRPCQRPDEWFSFSSNVPWL